VLNVIVENESWKTIRGLKSLAEKAVVAATLASHRKKEITILFASDEKLKTLNHDWRGLKKPTNVLSFPAPQNIKLPRGEIKPLGDIALAFETVEREATSAKITLKAHTTHLIVHGVLHLLGYDHIDPAEAEIMEAKEIRILKTLNIANPYLNYSS
jgi:probable rRNA maturation factor